MPGLPKAVVQERYERLVALVDDIAWQENTALVGRRVELLVAEGEGRKDAATHRMSGRGPDNRLVHFTPPPGARVRPGDMVAVQVTYAAPHHLVSDAPVLAVRPTRAGDAWEARTAPVPTGVSLGMPRVGPPQLPAPPASEQCTTAAGGGRAVLGC
jgi:tRNA-2-methylthio-N6-dimethylallyladenosine synthase